MQTDLGTIYKLNIHIDGLPSTMDDVDFRCKFWTYRKELTVEKKDMIRIDENNYMAVIDSSLLGRGTIKVQTTVLVPDTDVDGGVRREIYTAYRNIGFEREAYMNQGNMGYLQGRGRYAWVKYMKGGGNG